MTGRTLFLVDILVNASGALLMVFLVFVSHQYSAEARVPVSAEQAVVMKITLQMGGPDPATALKDTLMTLCAPGGRCTGSPISVMKAAESKPAVGYAADPFAIPASGEQDRAAPFMASAMLGRPRVDYDRVSGGTLSILLPCPVPGQGWSLSLDYGTIFDTVNEPTARNVTMTAQLLGIARDGATIEPAQACTVPISADTDGVCGWSITGETGCDSIR